jgi:proton glutamate symport protein
MTRAISPLASSMAALLVGLGLGLALRSGAPGPLPEMAAIGVWAGALWLGALSLVAVPVSALCLLGAIATSVAKEGIGRLLGATVAAIVASLVAIGLLTALTLPPILTWTVAPVELRLVTPSVVPVEEGTSRHSALSRAAAVAEPLTRHFLAVLFVTAGAGVLLARARSAAADHARRRVAVAQQQALDGMRRLIIGLPVGLFAIGVEHGQSLGFRAAGIVGQFTVLTCTALVVATLLMYPVVALGARVRAADFARAVWPGQFVAVCTRSSIAALPALLEGADRNLRLNAVGRAVLPLATSIFKLNRAVSAMAKLLFVAHVYGVPLSATTIAVFLATTIAQSFSALGIPGGGTVFKAVPAYLAAGLPLDAIVLLEAADAATDVFKTVLNVTANLGLSAVLARMMSSEAATGGAAASDSP